MITDFILTITNFIISTIDALGYAGVVLLMAIESAAIPLPSEIIMPFSGSLVAVERFTLFGLALAGATGSLLGSLATYALGYFGGRPLIIRYGRYVLITEHDLALIERFFQKFGKFSVFLGRILPVVRTFISIPAGIGRVSLWPFIWTAFVGSFIWSYFLAWVGLKLGENWHNIEVYFRRFDLVIVIAIVMVIAWWIRRHLKGH